MWYKLTEVWNCSTSPHYPNYKYFSDEDDLADYVEEVVDIYSCYEGAFRELVAEPISRPPRDWILDECERISGDIAESSKLLNNMLDLLVETD